MNPYSVQSIILAAKRQVQPTRKFLEGRSRLEQGDRWIAWQASQQQLSLEPQLAPSLCVGPDCPDTTAEHDNEMPIVHMQQSAQPIQTAQPTQPTGAPRPRNNYAFYNAVVQRHQNAAMLSGRK